MIPSLIVDAIILLALGWAAYDGYRRGFIALTSEVIAVLLGFGIALWLTPAASPLLARFFAIPALVQRPISFFILWTIFQIIINVIFNYFYGRVPSQAIQSKVNRIAGILPSLLKSGITLAVILTLLLVIPLNTTIKDAVSNSRLAAPLTKLIQAAEPHFLSQYQREVSDSLTFLTNSPYFPKPAETGEFIELNFTTKKVSIDAKSETEMLEQLNAERRRVGLNDLIVDPKLRDVARAHAKDMFARGYFAHETPEGKSPFQRLSEANVLYLTAGENLAMAPNVDLAHTGLMNSPKHKENILYPQFGKVGIGVIDGGIYGKMFVQEFTN